MYLSNFRKFFNVSTGNTIKDFLCKGLKEMQAVHEKHIIIFWPYKNDVSESFPEISECAATSWCTSNQPNNQPKTNKTVETGSQSKLIIDDV